MNKMRLFTIGGIIVCLILGGIYALLLRKQVSPGSDPDITPLLTMTVVAPTITPLPSYPTGTPNSPPDVKLYEAQSSREALLRPDVTVSNNVPHAGKLYIADVIFRRENPGYYEVIVRIDPAKQNEAKKEFLDWIISLGIPRESISKLHLTYDLLL